MPISLTTQMANGELLFRPSTVPGAAFTQLHIDIINASPTALAFYEAAATNNVPVTIEAPKPDGSGGTFYNPNPSTDGTAPNGTIVIDARDFTSRTNPNASPAADAVANALNVVLRGLHETAHAMDHLDGTPLVNPSTFGTPSAYALARSTSEGNSLATEGKVDAELQGKRFIPPGQTEAITINRDSYIAGDRLADSHLHTLFSDSNLTAEQQTQSAKEFGTLTYLNYVQSTTLSPYLTQDLKFYASYWSGIPIEQITDVNIDDTSQSWLVSSRSGTTETTVSFGDIDTTKLPESGAGTQAITRLDQTPDDDGNLLVQKYDYANGTQTTTLYDPERNVLNEFQRLIPGQGAGPAQAPSPSPSADPGDNNSGTAPRTPLPNPTDASSRDAVNGSDSDSDRATAQLNAERIATQLSAQQAVNNLNATIALLSLGNFADLSDIQRLGVLNGALNAIGGRINALQPGTVLGVPAEVGAFLGLLGAAESRNPLAIGASVVSLGDILSASGTQFSDAIAGGINGVLDIGAVGADILPFVGVLLAFSGDNDVAKGASLLSLAGYLELIPGGQLPGLVLAVVGTLLNLFDDNDLPTISGASMAVWNDAGEIHTESVNYEHLGGGSHANNLLGPILVQLQRGLDTVIDPYTQQPFYGINPARLPSIGYFDNPDGFQYSPSGPSFSLRLPDQNGQSVPIRYYDTQGFAADGSGDTIGRDYVRYAQDALAPAWLIDTAFEQYKQPALEATRLQAEIARREQEASAIAPSGYSDGESFIEVPSPNRGRYAQLSAEIASLQPQVQALRQQASQVLIDLPRVSELGQTAVVSADGASQSISALSFTLPGTPATAAAPATALAAALATQVSALQALGTAAPTPAAAINQVLVNLDADAYLERLNWVGSNQALLGIDINGNQRIETGELLTGNLDWLDANHDGRIDARDPAFRAIRVWVDVNSDGDSQTRVSTTTVVNGQERITSSSRDETTNLYWAGISAINFRGANGPTIERTANGTVSTQALTEHTLTGTTLGVSYRTQAGVAGIIRTDEQADGSGQNDDYWSLAA